MQRLLLFAKRPRPGKVKTRLVPPLRQEQALSLYRAFLADQIRFLRSFAGRLEVELCLDGPWKAGLDDPSPEGVATTLQGPGNLGARLARAFERSHSAGAGATVVIGADSPTLPAAHVDGAFRALEEGREAVIAPARDGGYVLVGMGRPLPELFRDVPWGGAEVVKTTAERARAAGIDLHGLAAWYDVDDADALELLRNEIRDPGVARRAPETARMLDRLDREGTPVV